MEVFDLKKKYEVMVKKHKLPSFEEVNANFEIEKIDRDSDTLLRAVRKMMMEKIVNSLGFVEMLLTAMNAPRMYHSYIKNISMEDRKRLEKMYDVLTDLSMASLEREVDYDEKKEAMLIIQIFKMWNSIKPDFRIVMEGIRKPSNNSAKKERSYFG